MMTEGMRCLRFAIVLAALLCLFVNAQCIAKCAVLPCDQPASSQPDLPPCHRHTPDTPHATHHCGSTAFVLSERSDLPVVHGALAILAPPAQALTLEAAVFTQPAAAPAPPDIGVADRQVLRI